MLSAVCLRMLWYPERVAVKSRGDTGMPQKVLYQFVSPAGVPADVPAKEFSAERAMAHLCTGLSLGVGSAITYRTCSRSSYTFLLRLRSSCERESRELFRESEARQQVRVERDQAHRRVGGAAARSADDGTHPVLFGLALRRAAGERQDPPPQQAPPEPPMMNLAGRRHWYAAVIRHRGRRSGREYTTPVVAVPAAGDAFVIPLPYGEEVDWLKNVLAAGRATVGAKGEIYDIFEPEVIAAAEASPLLDERHRRTWRRFGIEHFLSRIV